MRIDRRRFLTALGLGGATLALPGALSNEANAGGLEIPKRVVFWITGHGTIWPAYHMALAGGSPTSTNALPLAGVDEAEFSPILQALAPFKSKLNVLEGIARTPALEYERVRHTQDGYDLNRHHFGQAMLMTCVDPLQRPGTTCIGGGESVDQVMGRALAQPGRWASRVYGDNHQHPYNFVAPGEAAPREESARTAYEDILGLYVPPDTGSSRDAAIQRARGTVLDFAANEFDLVAPRLPREDREKLERHAQLVRDLEQAFTRTSPTASCNPTFDEMGHYIDQFSRVMTLALSCDMTRVITFVAPGLAMEDFGFPPGDLHQDVAHNSVRGGGMYDPEHERGMIEYNRWYARAFRTFLEELDSVPEGDGTLLDHTAVVWMSELATGDHDLHDLPIVVAGGANGALRTGQYVRFARVNQIEGGWGGRCETGPSQTQFYLTLMNALGMTQSTFGIETAERTDGTTMSLRGPIPELLV